MTCESFTFNTNKEIIKSTIKFLKTFELFSDLHLLFSKEHWMNSSLFKGFMYIYEQHLIAGILWLGSVLGSIPCMFYSFVGVYLYDFLVYLCRVRIKYYKVICKNCKKPVGEHPQWLGATSWNSETFTLLNDQKLYFWRFFTLNE